MTKTSIVTVVFKFFVEFSTFSTFGKFSLESLEAGRVLRLVEMQMGARDSVGDCDSKKSTGKALFSCSEGCGNIGVDDELGVVGSVGNSKLTSLEASGLARV